MVFAAACDFNHLPPENTTSTNMYVIKRRVIRFASTHNRLPNQLSELPPVSDFVDTTNDVWGNEIQYIVNGTTVRLFSYGKDQKPDGSGDNLDVVGVFDAKNEGGEWKDESRTDDNSDWEKIPLIDR